MNNAALPDLTDVTQIVDAQAKNLVSIGMGMLQDAGADDLMRQEMPPACQEILQASATLI